MTKELVRSREDTENLSMEEILASIRGIINDDMIETNNTEKKETKAAEQEDVLELTDIVEETNQAQIEDPQNKTDLLDTNNNIEQNKVTQQEETEEEEISASTPEIKQEENLAQSANEPEVSTSIQSEEIKTTTTPTIENDDLSNKRQSSLISEETANKASGAMKDLINKSAKQHSDGLGFRSGITVEDIVIETMKPYLTKWLDENLPGIVKHLVQKEIQKLVPRDE
jgi:cell pole-organizing protein PopZ